MGTVGLSFGSPTSGAGFNVSSTVSEIMANLQNVETPWKNQISSIGSQDTVLSTLGTLLSNLSTDMASLTDATGILSEKTGSSSDSNVLELTAASNSAVAGTHTVVVSNLAATSSGYLKEIASANDTIAGSIVIQVGSGTAQTVAVNSSSNTLSSLASAINSAGIGVTAAVLTDASGSRLSIVSGTSGAGGDLTITSGITDATPPTLSYTDSGLNSSSLDTGTLGSVASTSDKLSGSVVLQVGTGTAQTITLSSNSTLTSLQQAITSSGLGVTASIITNSDGTSSISLTSPTSGSSGALTVTSSVTDTTPAALGYTNAVSGANASLTVDGVKLTTSSNTVSGLIPGLTFQLLATSDTPVQVVIGNYNSGVESTVNSLVSDYNSLVSAMNAQEQLSSSNTVAPLYGSPTLSMLQQDILGGINLVNPNGYVDAVSTSSTTTLSGSIAIQVGTAAAQTFTLSSDNSIAGLAAAINAKNIGVTAAVVTANGASTLTLASQTAGTAGALVVTSGLKTTAPTPLSFSALTDASGVLGNLTASEATNDKLSGSVVVSFGTSAPQTFTLDSSSNTLASLATAISASNLGVNATVLTSGNGTQGLSIVSQTGDTNGTMEVTSSIVDATTPTTKALNYNASSDIGSLSALGISVNNDGSLSLDVNALDSLLNSDYSGVQGLFQNANSWGVTFNQMLTNAGSSNSTGIISLATSSNSSIESTLNADISREDSLISAQSKSLTTELNSANETLQMLPSQLSQVNELYSAITGYNQSQS
jgi:flagellar hook-associated protein 2